MDIFERHNIRVVPSGGGDMRFSPLEVAEEHSPYQMERVMFSHITNGDEAGLLEFLTNVTSGQPARVGYLAADTLKQAQYLAVAFVTLATRYAIEGGLSEYEAYGLSDAFVQEIDRQSDVAVVIDKCLAMVLRFARRVAAAKPEQHYSPPVRKALGYIRRNCQAGASAAQLAAHCGLSAGYLAALFKRETGTTLAKCVNEHRLQAACTMLEEGSLPYNEIATHLGFCSQSHFIQCFRARYGTTPRRWRAEAQSREGRWRAPGGYSR